MYQHLANTSVLWSLLGRFQWSQILTVLLDSKNNTTKQRPVISEAELNYIDISAPVKCTRAFVQTIFIQIYLNVENTYTLYSRSSFKYNASCFFKTYYQVKRNVQQMWNSTGYLKNNFFSRSWVSSQGFCKQNHLKIMLKYYNSHAKEEHVINFGQWTPRTFRVEFHPCFGF